MRVTAGRKSESERDREKEQEQEEEKEEEVERDREKGESRPKSNLPKDRIDRTCNRTCNVSKFLAAFRFVPLAMVI